MKRKKYFYFSSSHSFEYPFIVYWTFVRKEDVIWHRKDRSKWIEERDFIYYGEPVTCIIPAQTMEYSFVFNMLNSEDEDSDNIFGAINYLLRNNRDRFLADTIVCKCSQKAKNIMFQYFGIKVE